MATDLLHVVLFAGAWPSGILRTQVQALPGVPMPSKEALSHPLPQPWCWADKRSLGVSGSLTNGLSLWKGPRVWCWSGSQCHLGKWEWWGSAGCLFHLNLAPSLDLPKICLGSFGGFPVDFGRSCNSRQDGRKTGCPAPEGQEADAMQCGLQSHSTVAFSESDVHVCITYSLPRVNLFLFL